MSEPTPTPAAASASPAAPEAAADTTVKKSKRWLPLESNPELMNKYIYTLGVGPSVTFTEIYGVDPDLLAMVPSPVYAVISCYPISEAAEKHRAEEAKRIEEKGQSDSKAVWYTKQTVGNACGTVALLHAILNNKDWLSLEKGKFFSNFLEETKDMTPEQRAAALENNTDIEVQHHAVASDAEAKSDVTTAMNTNLHFNAFVCVDNKLWELDGRKKTPICHGETTQETLLQDAVNVVKQFMARDPTSVLFNMVALTPAME